MEKREQVYVGINHDLNFDQRVDRKLVWINGEPVGILASRWPSMLTCYGFPIATGSNTIQVSLADPEAKPPDAEWLLIKAAVYTDGQKPESKRLDLRRVDGRLDGTFATIGGRIDKITPGLCSNELGNRLRKWVVHVLDLMEEKDYGKLESVTGRTLDRQALPPWGKFPLVARARSVDEIQFALGKSMVLIFPRASSNGDAEEVLWKSEVPGGYGCKISAISFIVDEKGRCFLAPGSMADVKGLGNPINISAFDQ